MSATRDRAGRAAAGSTARSREQSLVLAVAVLGSFVSFLDGTIVNVALPAIETELGGGLTTQQWVVDAYLVTLGALILVAGSLSDIFGRLAVLRTGLVGFGAMSVLIALAPTAEVLIAARALQGVAGALLVPSSLALIMANFRGEAQGRAIGAWTGWTSVAVLAGPIVGGLFVDLASWRFAFAINALPVVVTLVLIARLAQRDERTPGARLDVWGAVLTTVGLAGVVFGLIEQQNLGWAHPAVLASLVGGSVALVAFVWRQHVAAAPLMPLSLYRVRNFSWGNLATLFVYGALSLSGLALVLFLQERAGYPATLAGLTMIPSVVLLIALSTFVGRLAGRFGPRPFMTVGPVLCAIGYAMLLWIDESVELWQLAVPLTVFGLGLATTVAPLTSAVLGSIEPSRSGIASAVNNAVARIAGLVAIALMGAIAGDALDLEGFRRVLTASVVLFALGGLVSLVGIRRPPTETANSGDERDSGRDASPRGDEQSDVDDRGHDDEAEQRSR